MFTNELNGWAIKPREQQQKRRKQKWRINPNYIYLRKIQTSLQNNQHKNFICIK